MTPDELADAALAAFEDAGGDASPRRVRDLVVALSTHATALWPLVLRDPTIAKDVLSRPLHRPDSERSFRRLFSAATKGLEDTPELRKVLRRRRHRAVVRIALREVMRLADIDQTSAEMARLASAATDAAVEACHRTVDRMYGTPVDVEGKPIPLAVLGMGKLGGEELNLGSDIDLCFFYETDEGTVGDGRISVHEYFAKVASRASKALGDVTDDGFVFRVDLRLRPEGSRGPLVNSLASAERYYETWGRTWERAALLRAQPIAGDLAFGERLLTALRPFVYRREVQPGLADEMAEMLLRSRRELGVDPEREIKLGRGGIREAEFFVQSLQLIWGGQHPELQVTGTVEALRRLGAAGLVTNREAAGLEADWALLRRVEHRIHMQAGYQTHELPSDPGALAQFAKSLGFSDSLAFDEELAAARGRVADLFASIISGEERPAPELQALCDLVASGAGPSEVVDQVAAALPVMDPDEAAAHLVRLGRRASSPLGASSRERLPELGALLLREVAEAGDPDAALRYLADFFARLGGSWGYGRLLMQQPRLMRRLVGLFGASATLSSALVSRPEALDDLLVSPGAITAEAIAEMHQRPPLVFAEEPPDPEDFLRALRGAKQEVSLAVGLALVAEELGPTDVELLLTCLAEHQIRAALHFATAETTARRGVPRRPSGEDAGLIVVGLGKLGARELGFGSDLDLMFLYDQDGETEPGPSGSSTTNAEAFTRVAQLTMRMLSQPSAEGRGYETDTRLRPSGSQGMLVVSLSAFDRYHESRAAPWERQALVRARPVAGDSELRKEAQERFADIAYGRDVIVSEEVAAMRRRIEEELAGERPGRYHPKLGYGGLVDVEFVVQWLQMRHGEDSNVRSAHTLEALSALHHRGYVGADDAEALYESYRWFRRVEQALKLMDETREPIVTLGSPVIPRLARRLGLRARDGTEASEVLLATWRRHARGAREIFERPVSPVGIDDPWGDP